MIQYGATSLILTHYGAIAFFINRFFFSLAFVLNCILKEYFNESKPKMEFQ